jgi:hypothetical protein
VSYTPIGSGLAPDRIDPIIVVQYLDERQRKCNLTEPPTKGCDSLNGNKISNGLCHGNSAQLKSIKNNHATKLDFTVVESDARNDDEISSVIRRLPIEVPGADILPVGKHGEFCDMGQLLINAHRARSDASLGISRMKWSIRWFSSSFEHDSRQVL